MGKRISNKFVFTMQMYKKGNKQYTSGVCNLLQMKRDTDIFVQIYDN